MTPQFARNAILLLLAVLIVGADTGQALFPFDGLFGRQSVPDVEAFASRAWEGGGPLTLMRDDAHPGEAFVMARAGLPRYYEAEPSWGDGPSRWRNDAYRWGREVLAGDAAGWRMATDYPTGAWHSGLGLGEEPAYAAFANLGLVTPVVDLRSVPAVQVNRSEHVDTGIVTPIGGDNPASDPVQDAYNRALPAGERMESVRVQRAAAALRLEHAYGFQVLGETLSDGARVEVTLWDPVAGWTPWQGLAPTGDVLLLGDDRVAARRDLPAEAGGGTIEAWAGTDGDAGAGLGSQGDLPGLMVLNGTLHAEARPGGVNTVPQPRPWLYGGPIESSGGFGAPWVGFGGGSGGTVESIFDLSAYAGRLVRFRFVVAAGNSPTGDPESAGLGWVLDRMEVTAAGPAGVDLVGLAVPGDGATVASASAVAPVVAVQNRGPEPAKLRIQISAEGPVGSGAVERQATLAAGQRAFVSAGKTLATLTQGGPSGLYQVHAALLHGSQPPEGVGLATAAIPGASADYLVQVGKSAGWTALSLDFTSVEASNSNPRLVLRNEKAVIEATLQNLKTSSQPLDLKGAGKDLEVVFVDLQGNLVDTADPRKPKVTLPVSRDVSGSLGETPDTVTVTWDWDGSAIARPLRLLLRDGAGNTLLDGGRILVEAVDPPLLDTRFDNPLLDGGCTRVLDGGDRYGLMQCDPGEALTTSVKAISPADLSRGATGILRVEAQGAQRIAVEQIKGPVLPEDPLPTSNDPRWERIGDWLTVGPGDDWRHVEGSRGPLEAGWLRLRATADGVSRLGSISLDLQGRLVAHSDFDAALAVQSNDIAGSVEPRPAWLHGHDQFHNATRREGAEPVPLFGARVDVGKDARYGADGGGNVPVGLYLDNGDVRLDHRPITLGGPALLPLPVGVQLQVPTGDMVNASVMDLDTAFSLDGVRPRLEFRHWIDTGSGASGEVQVRRLAAGSASTQETVDARPPSVASVASSDPAWETVAVFRGQIPGQTTVPVTVPLDAYAGDNVSIRFVYATGAAADANDEGGRGWLIEGVLVTLTTPGGPVTLRPDGEPTFVDAYRTSLIQGRTPSPILVGDHYNIRFRSAQECALDNVREDAFAFGPALVTDPIDLTTARLPQITLRHAGSFGTQHIIGRKIDLPFVALEYQVRGPDGEWPTGWTQANPHEPRTGDNLPVDPRTGLSRLDIVAGDAFPFQFKPAEDEIPAASQMLETTWDLEKLRTQVVRFRLHAWMETVPGRPGEPLVRSPHVLFYCTIEGQNYLNWNVYSLEVREQRPLTDGAVTAITVDTDDTLRFRTLEPQVFAGLAGESIVSDDLTEARVTLRNRGLVAFAGEVDLLVTPLAAGLKAPDLRFIDESVSPPVARTPARGPLALEPNASETLRFQVDFRDASPGRFLVSAKLRVTDGIDGDPTNDLQSATLQMLPVRRLGIDPARSSVNPAITAPDAPRSVIVQVRNEGNVDEPGLRARAVIVRMQGSQSYDLPPVMDLGELSFPSLPRRTGSVQRSWPVSAEASAVALEPGVRYAALVSLHAVEEEAVFEALDLPFPHLNVSRVTTLLLPFVAERRILGTDFKDGGSSILDGLYGDARPWTPSTLIDGKPAQPGIAGPGWTLVPASIAQAALDASGGVPSGNVWLLHAYDGPHDVEQILESPVLPAHIVAGASRGVFNMRYFSSVAQGQATLEMRLVDGDGEWRPIDSVRNQRVAIILPPDFPQVNGTEREGYDTSKDAFANVLVPAAANQPPSVTLGANPVTVRVGDTVAFNRGATDADGTVAPANMVLDFGDGSTTVTGSGSVQHRYMAPGLYPATLTAKDDDGATGSKQAYVQVNDVESTNQFPRATVHATRSARIGEPITVQADGFDADGSIAAYALDFGDGTPKTLGIGALDRLTVQHTYAAQGRFPITLTVRDDDGATSLAWSRDADIPFLHPPFSTDYQCPTGLPRPQHTVDNRCWWSPFPAAKPRGDPEWRAALNQTLLDFHRAHPGNVALFTTFAPPAAGQPPGVGQPPPSFGLPLQGNALKVRDDLVNTDLLFPVADLADLDRRLDSFGAVIVLGDGLTTTYASESPSLTRMAHQPGDAANVPPDPLFLDHFELTETILRQAGDRGVKVLAALGPASAVLAHSGVADGAHLTVWQAHQVPTVLPVSEAGFSGPGRQMRCTTASSSLSLPPNPAPLDQQPKRACGETRNVGGAPQFFPTTDHPRNYVYFAPADARSLALREFLAAGGATFDYQTGFNLNNVPTPCPQPLHPLGGVLGATCVLPDPLVVFDRQDGSPVLVTAPDAKPVTVGDWTQAILQTLESTGGEVTPTDQEWQDLDPGLALPVGGTFAIRPDGVQAFEGSLMQVRLRVTGQPEVDGHGGFGFNRFELLGTPTQKDLGIRFLDPVDGDSYGPGSSFLVRMKVLNRGLEPTDATSATLTVVQTEGNAQCAVAAYTRSFGIPAVAAGDAITITLDAAKLGAANVWSDGFFPSCPGLPASASTKFLFTVTLQPPAGDADPSDDVDVATAIGKRISLYSLDRVRLTPNQAAVAELDEVIVGVDATNRGTQDEPASIRIEVRDALSRPCHPDENTDLIIACNLDPSTDEAVAGLRYSTSQSLALPRGASGHIDLTIPQAVLKLEPGAYTVRVYASVFDGQAIASQRIETRMLHLIGEGAPFGGSAAVSDGIDDSTELDVRSAAASYMPPPMEGFAVGSFPVTPQGQSRSHSGAYGPDVNTRAAGPDGAEQALAHGWRLQDGDDYGTVVDPSRKPLSLEWTRDPRASTPTNPSKAWPEATTAEAEGDGDFGDDHLVWQPMDERDADVVPLSLANFERPALSFQSKHQASPYTGFVVEMQVAERQCDTGASRRWSCSWAWGDSMDGWHTLRPAAPVPSAPNPVGSSTWMFLTDGGVGGNTFRIVPSNPMPNVPGLWGQSSQAPHTRGDDWQRLAYPIDLTDDALQAYCLGVATRETLAAALLIKDPCRYALALEDRNGEVPRPIRFRMRAASFGGETGVQQWRIDDIALTDHSLSFLGAATRSLPVAEGKDNIVPLRIVNRGAVDDDVVVSAALLNRLTDASVRLSEDPSEGGVQELSLTIPAGERRLVWLHLKIGLNNPGSTGTLMRAHTLVSARSTFDETAGATLFVDGSFTKAAYSDLFIASLGVGRDLGGDHGKASAHEPASVTVLVRNVGRTPPSGTVQVRLFEERYDEETMTPIPGTLRPALGVNDVPQAADLAPLEAYSKKRQEATIGLTWVPRDTGLYLLTAVVNREGLTDVSKSLPELSQDNNVLTRFVAVGRVRFPDLHILDAYAVEVDLANHTEARVDRLVAGHDYQLRALVANTGDATALAPTVQYFLGSDPKPFSIASNLFSDESDVFPKAPAQVVANSTVLANIPLPRDGKLERAFTIAVESKSVDATNVGKSATLRLPIDLFRWRVETGPATAEVVPGLQTILEYRINNTGTALSTPVVFVSGGTHLVDAHALQPPALQPGENATLKVVVTGSRALTADAKLPALVLSSREDLQMRVPLPVSLRPGGAAAYQAAGLPAAGVPGPLKAEVVLDNPSNAPTTWRLLGVGDPLRAIEAAWNVTLPAFDRRIAQIPVEVAPHTAPGRHAPGLEFLVSRGKADAGLLVNTTLALDVTPSKGLQARMVDDTVSVLRGLPAKLDLRLENTGNLPLRLEAYHEATPGVVLEAEQTLRLAPGEVRTLAVRVDPGQAGRSLGQSTVAWRPDDDAALLPTLQTLPWSAEFQEASLFIEDTDLFTLVPAAGQASSVQVRIHNPLSSPVEAEALLVAGGVVHGREVLTVPGNSTEAVRLPYLAGRTGSSEDVMVLVRPAGSDLKPDDTHFYEVGDVVERDLSVPDGSAGSFGIPVPAWAWLAALAIALALRRRKA